MVKCFHYRMSQKVKLALVMCCVITRSGKMTGTMDIRGVSVLFSLFQSELTPMTEPQQKP